MSRRLMLRKASGGGDRLYIFQNGEYGAWLNGAEFADGGYYKANSSGASVGIADSNLVFSFNISRNRTSTRSFGLLLPNGIAPKALGISMQHVALNSQWYGGIYLGASTMFSPSTSKDTALATYEENALVIPNGNNDYSGENQAELNNNNFRYVYVSVSSGASTAITVTVPITEFWIEV